MIAVQLQSVYNTICVCVNEALVDYFTSTAASLSSKGLTKRPKIV